MLDIAKMSSADAQHTIAVHQWITRHLAELTALENHPEDVSVSANAMQSQFHRVYTSLQSTRFVPLTNAMFTDQDALAEGSVTEPNVLLYQPTNRRKYLVVDYLNTPILSEITPLFGIDGKERTWQQVDREEAHGR